MSRTPRLRASLWGGRATATLAAVALVGTGLVATSGPGDAVPAGSAARSYDASATPATGPADAPASRSTGPATPSDGAAPAPQPAPGPRARQAAARPPAGAAAGADVGEELVDLYGQLLQVARTSGATGQEVLYAAPSLAAFDELLSGLSAVEQDALEEANGPLPVGQLSAQLRAARLMTATAANRGVKAAEAGRRAPAVLPAARPVRASVECAYVDAQYTPLRSVEFYLALVDIYLETALKVAEDLTKPDPTGIAELSAVLPLVILTSVVKGLLIGASAALDLANCVQHYLRDRVRQTDNTLVEAFGLVGKADDGLAVIVKGIEAAAKAAEEAAAGPTSGPGAPPGGGGTGAPPGEQEPEPFDLDAALAALANVRTEVQQAQAGGTQVLANAVRTAQETLGERVRRLRDRAGDQGVPPAPAGTALVIGRELAAGGAPLADLLLPAAVGGLLDAPGGVRDVVRGAVDGAAGRGLAFDEAGAREALAAGDAALAERDWKAAHSHYRTAYLKVSS